MAVKGKIWMTIAAGLLAVGVAAGSACGGGPTRAEVIAKANDVYDCLESYPPYKWALQLNFTHLMRQFDTRTNFLHHALTYDYQSSGISTMDALEAFRRDCRRAEAESR